MRTLWQNIFGFNQLAKQHRITYDSDVEDAFKVHIGNKCVKFMANNEGLYYFTLPKAYKMQMIETVAENGSGYMAQQYEQAKEARKLYHNVGAPTVRNFK